MKITEWAEEDRPREKLMMKGVSALSDAELLAILIVSGTTEETAVSLMQRILRDNDNNLNRLGKLELRDLLKYNGIGPAKGISIIAALELGKRRKLQEILELDSITSSEDIFNLFHPIMCDLKNEEFWILLLNHNMKIINKVKLSSGSADRTVLSIKDIIRESIMNRATNIVLVHNHPDGSARPSKADIAITDKVNEACRLMELVLIDHIIVTEKNFYSFRDDNRF